MGENFINIITMRISASFNLQFIHTHFSDIFSVLLQVAYLGKIAMLKARLFDAIGINFHHFNLQVVMQARKGIEPHLSIMGSVIRHFEEIR